jgi:ketosteroid isomerase-like protein
MAAAAVGQRTLFDSRPGDLLEIARLEAEWNRVNEVSDVEGIELLLAEDSYHVGPSGRAYTKRQDVVAQRASRERKGSAGSTLRFIVSNQKIRLFSDVAVVTATGISITTLADGTKRYGNPFRTVHVWEKRDGRWFLTVDQVTGVGR